MGKLTDFVRDPLWSKLQKMSDVYYLIRSAILYRGVFRRFGKNSIIRRPLMISNPQFISIGERVSIRSGVRLEAVRSNRNRVPDLVIGDGTNIEQNVHI